MRDTIDKHGAIKSPSGSWIGVLVLNSWFIEPDGSIDDLKQEVKDWLDEHAPQPDRHRHGYEQSAFLMD